MTKPSDAAIARAFWAELRKQVELGVHAESNFGFFIRRVQECVWEIGYEHELTQCPKCRALMKPGLHCAGSPENPCPLKVKDD